MKGQITKALGDSAITLSVATGAGTKLGWFAWVNENAPALGFFAAVIFGIVGVYFHVKGDRIARDTAANKAEIDKLKKQLRESK